MRIVSSAGTDRVIDSLTQPMTCPECGAAMVLRTARTGARAGQQFYGCSRYPQCRTIVNIEAPQDPGSPGGAPAKVGRVARAAWSEFGRRGEWTSFYAPAGGRLRAWDAMQAFEDPGPWIRASSQAAFYLHGTTRDPEPGAKVVVDVVRRLLTRGDRPPVDPLVEDWILDRASLGSAALPAKHSGDLSRELSFGAPRPPHDEITEALCHREPFVRDGTARAADGQDLFGSPLESKGFSELCGVLGTAGQWVHIQPQLAGMLADPRDYRRADFLLAHPAGTHAAIEIDGAQHEAAREVDRDRDQALASSGITVVRVPAGIEMAASADVNAAIGSLRSGQPEDRALQLVWGPACAHRVARAVLEAFASGFLRGSEWRISITEPLGIAVPALLSFLEQLAAVCNVWGVDLAPEAVLLDAGGSSSWLLREGVSTYTVAGHPDPAEPVGDVSIHIDLFRGPWHELPESSGPTVVVRSTYLPFGIREGRLEGGRALHVPDSAAISEEALSRLLAAIFAKREFYPRDDGPSRRGQEIAIRRLLGGRDTVVLLPTGAGKSLIYQFAGLLLPGRTLVIDPIVALIDDQLSGLAAQGIDRAIGITGADRATGEAEAKLAEVRAGDALFCFVAPERLQQRKFREAIRALTAATPINVCVVDEAHCVSEWGHDFRTSYLDLGRVLREVGADVTGAAPPILALTGTASRAVLRDMLIELDIDRSDPEAIVSPKSFDRKELRFSVVKAREDEIVPRLMGVLRALPAQFGVTERQFFQPNGSDTYCGIVFSQTVNPPSGMRDGGLVSISELVARQLGAPVGMYSGSKPKDWRGNSWDEAKREYARAFKGNRQTVLVATKAYGMGIDKRNVRYTVHLGVPGSIEGYYQEAGRAGRDDQVAQCVIVHAATDRSFHDFMHGKSYRGIPDDVRVVESLLDSLGELDGRRAVSVPRSRTDDAADDEERAIHRLKLLGVVDDYLVDWGAGKFDLMLNPVTVGSLDDRLIAYVRRTQPGRVRAFERQLAADPPTGLRARTVSNARLLIEFIYETVVRSRQRALDEMVALADDAPNDQAIRDRILRYLDLGRIAGELESLVDQEPFSFEPWQELYLQLDTVDDAREWRGATARYLESSPDHPGLLAGRALAEAVVPGGDVQVFSRNLGQSLRSAVERYALDAGDLEPFLEWQQEWLHERRPQWSALGYVIAERALGPSHLDLFESLERRTIGDRDSAVASELGVVLARRLDRASRHLSDLASAAVGLTQ